MEAACEGRIEVDCRLANDVPVSRLYNYWGSKNTGHGHFYHLLILYVYGIARGDYSQRAPKIVWLVVGNTKAQTRLLNVTEYQASYRNFEDGKCSSDGTLGKPRH